MTGPYIYAAKLCAPGYPVPDEIFRRLGLGGGRVYKLDSYDRSVSGPYRMSACGRTVRALHGHGHVPGWMPALVLASLVHPDPTEELLASAVLLMTEGLVEVCREDSP